MKDHPLRRAMRMGTLACSILILGLQLSTAGPGRSRQPAPDSAVTPNTTFTDNVIISTGQTPELRLNQTTSAGLPAQTWSISGNELGFGVANFSISGYPLYISAGAPADSLRFESDGRVGFGTHTPAEALHIYRQSTPAIRLQQASPAQTWDIRASSNGFNIIDVTAGTFPFRIDVSTGNVGIGADIPAGHLHVNGAGNQLSIFQSSGNNAVQFRLQTNSINRRFVALNTAGTQQSQLVFGDNGAFDFLGATVSDVRMSLLANGNCGIGTNTPDQKLSVNGNASKPGGGSWATFSDERLKNIKGEFKSGLDEVLKLKPIRYEYKTDNAIGLKSEGEHVGFGAAAVQEIIPEAVTQNADGYLMVDNDPILWAMLNAIKEQNKEIADLKEQNRTLQTQGSEIAELKAQLKRLQSETKIRAR